MERRGARHHWLASDGDSADAVLAKAREVMANARATGGGYKLAST